MFTLDTRKLQKYFDFRNIHRGTKMANIFEKLNSINRICLFCGDP